MNKPIIKIYVSHRFDINSYIINNSLYIPVRCGAVYDKTNKLGIAGDNSGDNISIKRNSFCEFTVQYWAWKNENSDYYGLCHYRRYLTFNKNRYNTNNQEQIMDGFLDSKSARRYGLLDEKYIKEVVNKYDVIVNEAADTNKVPTPIGGQKSVYDHWAAHDGVFINKKVLPILLETIYQKCPKYYYIAVEYMNGNWHRGYNCYILRKNLFDELCKFQFSILFELEKKFKNNKLDIGYERTIGYMGEILYGIFIYYLQQKGRYKILETQLVYFEQTVLPGNYIQRYIDNILFMLRFRFENISYRVLPKGSKSRNFIKKIYFKLIKK